MPALLRSCLPLLVVALAAGEAEWAAWKDLEAQRQAAAAAAREAEDLLELIGEQLPAGADAALDAAREQLRAAEAAEQVLVEGAALGGPQERERLARAERSAALEVMLSTGATWRSKQAAAQAARAAATAALAKLPSDDLAVLAEAARARAQADALAGELDGVREVWRNRATLAAVNERITAARTEVDAAAKPVQEQLSAARKGQHAARKALNAAELTAGKNTATGQPIAARYAEQEALAAELGTQMKAAEAALRGAGWTEVKAQVEPIGPPKREKDKPSPVKATLRIPPECATIRAVLLSFMGTIDHDLHVDVMAREEGVAIAKVDGLGVFPPGHPLAGQRLLELLAALAQQSGHPELAHAPWIAAGCSTTTLTARNIGYWRPERTVAVISFAGGNLHQMVAPGTSLAGVPFLAINGELECFGPESKEGYKDGIRPEYGRQTQWVLIREQLRRWRAKDPEHLVSLLVLPRADHARWQRGASPATAEFLRAALHARLPATPGPDGGMRCRQVAAASGWLTDADLCAPRHPRAPEPDYTGPRDQAFWHPSQAAAAAAEDFHRGIFILPDPTPDYPVPAAWPEQAAPAVDPAPAP